MAHVIIIGGGVSGLSTAYEIARAGVKVTLLEARQLGAMASTWTLGGVRQSGRDPAELPLAKAAVSRWMNLAEELGAETGYRQRGNLRLARTVDEVETIRAMVAAQAALGLELQFLADLKSVRAIAPMIGETVLAASFCPGDGHADPDSAIDAYASAARRYGADIRANTPVLRLLREGGRITGVETREGKMRADRTIVAAGVHSPELLAPLGINLPLAVKRVCVMETAAAEPCFEQVFGVANADCAGRQDIYGHFRITTGIGDWPGRVNAWTEDNLKPAMPDIAALAARTMPLLPVLKTLSINRTWGGLIDLTPDALPMLDAPPDFPGLVIGAGFSGHGFGIAPVTGEILKALALGENCACDLAPFRARRFAAKADFAPLTLHG